MITITIDIDWAPDAMIDEIAGRLAEAGVRATWFLTHESPAVQRLLQSEAFEFGLHPNFLPGSTQGSTPEEIITNLKRLFPDVTLIRSHSLVQSSRLLMAFIDQGMTTDVSLFLPGAHSTPPHRLHLPNGSIIRIPYTWEDDVTTWAKEAFTLPKRPEGIYNFHPAHICLNIARDEEYQAYRAAATEDYEGFRREGEGTGSFFDALVAHAQEQGTTDIAERVTQWTRN